jgi:hypothetical protein
MSKTGHLVRHEHKSNHLVYYEPLPSTVYIAYPPTWHRRFYCAAPIPGHENTWYGSGLQNANYWGHYIVTPGNTDNYWDSGYFRIRYPQRSFTRQGSTNVWLNADATHYNYSTVWCVAAIRLVSFGVFEYFQYQGRNADASKLNVVMQSSVWTEQWSAWDNWKITPATNGGLESGHLHYAQKFTSSTLFGQYTYVGSVGWSNYYCWRDFNEPPPITIQRSLW